MRTRRLFVAFTVGGSIAAACLFPVTASADPTTYVVGRSAASCPNPDFSTIQAAVNAASSGDTIKVCAGTYPESVTIDTAGLTLLGAQAGVNASGRPTKGASIVTTNSSNGEFTLTGNADGTTIDGFVIQGGSGATANGVNDFAGSSGLTLANNLIKLNLNGINLQNPDGTQPATITGNAFVNNNAGGVGNGQSGTGIFISSGPADNTEIANNHFTLDSQTAINFAGDSSNLSTGLTVHDNNSLNDSTFVVATNSSNALIQDNTITTSDSGAPGGHGTGILDFGGNLGLRIVGNTLRATTTSSMSSGISVSNYAGSSQYTDVLNNTVGGYFNDIKVVTGSTGALVYGNHVSNAGNDGILAQSGTSNTTFSHNAVSGAGTYACEDDTTGKRTAGTANYWTKNTATSSTPAASPPGICPGGGSNT